MNFIESEINHYKKLGCELIPVWPWNKRIKNRERGKTPVHLEWTTRIYNNSDVNDWIKKGLNVGVRLKEDQIVIDFDPRNYEEGIDSEEQVADLFGYFDFEDLIESNPTVKSGSGGYHVYFQLPDGFDYQRIKTVIDNCPGVDIKKKGGYVVAAGSKHPCGEHYTWISTLDIQTISENILNKLSRELVDRDYQSGYGALNGNQLQELILDKLDVTEYSTNDTWFPIMCASHHATAGDGVEEFIDWSLGDLEYSDDEHAIRCRWDSLNDNRNVMSTIGTLIHELDKRGEQTSTIKAVLTFAQADILETDDDDTEEADIIKESREIAQQIDYSDIYDTEPNEEIIFGEEGAALEAVRNLPPDPKGEEVAKCLRLIRAADQLEASRCITLLAKELGLTKGDVKNMIKNLEEKIVDDLPLLLSRKALEVSFNRGKHLTCPPSGLLFAFKKTHWFRISDEFMAKLVQNTLTELKKRIDIEAPELMMIQHAVKLSRIEASTLKDRLHSTDLPPSVINCKNGELWLERDGKHKLRPHNYRSYLLNCLNVTYDPSAKCPLWMQTLEEIFRDFPDTDDMIRHLGEMMGYTIQPYKNIASWWLLRGPGGDGKSTVLKILEGILEDAQLNSTIKLLSAGSNDGYSHAMTSLVGKLAVIIEEVPAGYVLRDAGVKMLSENTKMEANPKGKEAFSFMYAGNLIMCSNGFPAVKDITHGMFRRANIIPFNRQFTKAGAADLNRASDILNNPTEMSGVLNWMLEGLARLRERGGFSNPESCVNAKEEWIGNSNNVVGFIKETVDRHPDSTICELKTLHQDYYMRWCDENSIQEKFRKTLKHFKQDLIDIGFEIKSSCKGSDKRKCVKVFGGVLKDSAGAVIDFE